MIPLSTLNYLFGKRVPRRILDIGTQNMLAASREQFLEFLETYGDKQDREKVATDMAHRSIIRPGEPTLYLSEVLEHTPIDYVSFDVCPGHKTEILDLNWEELPRRYKRKFDLVLNCGTSEHIFNQVNVFRAMHDATAVSGYVFHHVPTTGRIDHGYFCYHPRFFRELGEANSYELVDIWYKRGFKKDQETGIAVPRSSSMADVGIEIRGEKAVPLDIPNHGIGVLFRIKEERPFRLPLEISTRHAEPDKSVAASYKRLAPAAEGPNWLAMQLFANAMAARDSGNVAGAIALLLRAQEIDPDSGDIRDELARLVGNLRETLDNLLKQVDMFQDMMSSRRRLLRTLLKRLVEYPRDLRADRKHVGWRHSRP